MSKNSHSSQTITQVAQSSSFFDVAPSSEFFWTKKPIEEEARDFSSIPIILENEFRIRKKKISREWDTGMLILKGTYLIFKKVSSVVARNSCLDRRKSLNTLNILTLRKICIEWRSSRQLTRNTFRNILMDSRSTQTGSRWSYIVKIKNRCSTGSTTWENNVFWPTFTRIIMLQRLLGAEAMEKYTVFTGLSYKCDY